jgi:thiamine transport system permease protein
MRTALDRSRVYRGIIAFVVVCGLVLTALLAILSEGVPSIAQAFSGSTFGLLRFTLYQATLSALISLFLALPLAFYLDQLRDFPLRSAIIGLFALPLSMPVIVAVLAILTLLGRNGWISHAAASLGMNLVPDIYGLGGILLAHVFFNLPLATRLFLSALDETPDAHWKLAESLKFRTLDKFTMIAWPAMKAALPGIAGLVFLLCLTSFAVVLILGGGPASTTLEVAIYQSLAYDFDISRAATLTVVQLLAVVATLAFMRLFRQPPFATSSSPSSRQRFDSMTGSSWLAGHALIMSASVFVAAPFLVIFLDGVQADHWAILTSRSFLTALGASVGISATSAIAATLLGSIMVSGRVGADKTGSYLASLFAIAPNAILAFPPIVLGIGWFIAASKLGNPFQFAVPVIIIANTLMALPFVAQLLGPAFASSSIRHDRLCASLRVEGWNRFWLIDFPVRRRALLAAFAIAMALSLGDLGVIALFGNDGVQNLPALLFARMASYRGHDAAGIALYLMVLSIGLAVIARTLQGDHNGR